MDQTQTAQMSSPEVQPTENVETTMVQPPEQPQKETLEQKAETLTPEKRQELMKQAEEIRRVMTEVEAQKAGAMASIPQNEAKAASVQERINAVLGQHNILDIVRKEDAELIAIYEQTEKDLKSALGSIEKQLG